MEKPFTLDRRSAARRSTRWRRAGVTLGVAYPRRFHPSMKELKARDRRRQARHDRALLWRAEHAGRAVHGAGIVARDPGGGAGRGDDRARRPQCRRDDPSVRRDRRGLRVEPQARRRLRRRGHDQRHVRHAQRHVGEHGLLAGDDGQLPPGGVRHQGLRRAARPQTSISISPRSRTDPPTGRHAALPPQVTENRGVNALARRDGGVCRRRSKAARAYPVTPEQVLHGVAVFEAIVASAARAPAGRASRAIRSTTERKPDARHRALSRSPPAARRDGAEASSAPM